MRSRWDTFGGIGIFFSCSGQMIGKVESLLSGSSDNSKSNSRARYYAGDRLSKNANRRIPVHVQHLFFGHAARLIF
jgi:hypothetical protein